MPADPICRLIVNGSECGYHGQGDTAKEKLADLFRHQDTHKPHVTHDKGSVTVSQ